MPSGELLSRVERYHSTIADIYTTLTREKIHLRGVIVDDLCEAAIDSLGSYSGALEHLQVSCIYFCAADSDALAKRFYITVLPKHATVMRILCILPSYECGWCCNDLAMTAISLGAKG
jgi:hypothetical protein